MSSGWDCRCACFVRAIAERPTLRERAPFIVDNLCEATRTTARLGVLDDLEVAYIERLPGYRAGRYVLKEAARLPVHATALGKALLAFAPSQVVRMVLTPSLQAYTRTATLTTQSNCHRGGLRGVTRHGDKLRGAPGRPLRGGRASPAHADGRYAAVGVEVADLERAT